MPPTDPSSEGAQGSSLPAEPETESIDVTTVGLGPHAHEVEETARDLAAVRERLRESVATPEMRRLAEGLRRVIEEDRKRFEPFEKVIAEEKRRWEPFAREAERVRREMQRALDASGLGKRIEEIQRGIWGSQERERAAEAIRKIQEECGFLSREALERLEESGALSAADAAEARRLRGWDRNPSVRRRPIPVPGYPCEAPPTPATTTAPRSPVADPSITPQESPVRREAGAPTAAIPGIHEMVKTAVEEVLGSVFPPGFVDYVMKWKEGDAGADARAGEVAAPHVVIAPPGGWCGPGLSMKEAASRLGFENGRSLKSYLEYAKKKGRDPKGLAIFFAGGPGRTPDGKFREDALAAYEAVLKRLPEMTRAVTEGLAEQAFQSGTEAARKLPYMSLEKAFGRKARE